ncbi:transposase [Frankia sp. AiPs1]|uniref:ATP-binding protein n=1 Tax=Frankia sp. AiPa1 TaxID=573492 RepID=UPI0027E3F789|nr:ATP-binding protein [Frankia sp. AiPa1]
MKAHPRKPRGQQTDLGDYPPEKIAFHMRTPAWCRTQAEKVGPARVELVGGLLAENALYRLRAAQGVVGLADRHDPARLETVRGKATAVGDLYGPVGVGKTHIAQALGHQAVPAGADVRFTTLRALADLAGGHADGTWTRRLAELARPALLVDDFAMRELTATQTDDLYELVRERSGKSVLLTSNRSPVDWYPLFPNPAVAESLLDRLVNAAHQVVMNGQSYRPHKRPRNPVVPPASKTTS